MKTTKDIRFSQLNRSPGEREEWRNNGGLGVSAEEDRGRGQDMPCGPARFGRAAGVEEDYM